jgi:hypothetical protein
MQLMSIEKSDLSSEVLCSHTIDTLQQRKWTKNICAKGRSVVKYLFNTRNYLDMVGINLNTAAECFRQLCPHMFQLILS